MTKRRGRPSAIKRTDNEDGTVDISTTVEGIPFEFRRGADGRLRSVGVRFPDLAIDQAYARERIIEALDVREE